MKRYRVLRLITWLPRGGIERKIVAVLPRLDPELFDAHVCCLRERGPLADELEAQGVPVHVIPFRRRWDLHGLRRLHELVRHLGINLVHAHMYRANTPATALKLMRVPVKVIAHYHNVATWESWRQVVLDRFLALRRDLNLAVSEAVREDVVRTLRVPPEKVRVLYNGVDTTEFHPLDARARADARARLGLPAEARLIVMAARFVTQKNHAWVVETIQPILAEFPDVMVVFAGSGPQEARVQELVHHLNCTKRFVFLGSRSDIAEVLGCADVSILPSSREGFSNTILESLACGLPVIASRVGGNAEVLRDGENGFLLDMQDTLNGLLPDRDQFLGRLRVLLGDEVQRERMRSAALATSRRFSLDAMVAATSKLYLELLSGQSWG